MEEQPAAPGAPSRSSATPSPVAARKSHNPCPTHPRTVQDRPPRSRYLACLDAYGGGPQLKRLTHFGVAGATKVFAVLAVAGSALLVGSPSSSLSPPDSLHAAELVASHFIGGFENFSYRHPLSSRALAGLATPALAARLRSSPQAASGPELAAERFVATARVSGFAVENKTATGIRLLARTTEHISTTHGSTTTARLVPVSLTLTRSRWRVADVGGIQGVTHHSIRQRTVVPPAPPTEASPSVPDAVTVQDVQDVGGIPSNYLSWMQGAAAAECPGLPWEVLAGIAKVESDFGQSTLPGVDSGSNSAGAEGPMQFEPATFRAYATVAPGERIPPRPMTPKTPCTRPLGCSVRMAVELLVFWTQRSSTTTTPMPMWRWCSPTPAHTSRRAGPPSNSQAPRGSAQGIALGSVVVADAEAYLGTPYVWGGEKPGVGFDCSGLVQWVYAEAGISLPRVAQDQYRRRPSPSSRIHAVPGRLGLLRIRPASGRTCGHLRRQRRDDRLPLHRRRRQGFDRVSSVSLGYVGATRPEIPESHDWRRRSRHQLRDARPVGRCHGLDRIAPIEDSSRRCLEPPSK